MSKYQQIIHVRLTIQDGELWKLDKNSLRSPVS